MLVSHHHLIAVCASLEQGQLITVCAPQEQGLELSVTYKRRPFFLRRDIAAWRHQGGVSDALSDDATRGEVAEAMGWKGVGTCTGHRPD